MKKYQLFSLEGFAPASYLVKDVNVVVGQVEGHHAAKCAESPLLHPDDVTALQIEVGEVRCDQKCPSGQNLQVVIPQVQFDCDLRRTLNTTQNKSDTDPPVSWFPIRLSLFAHMFSIHTYCT